MWEKEFMIKPIISAAQAAKLVESGWTITTGGFGSCGHPEALTRALKERFFEMGSPRDLSLVFAAGQGDKGERGLNQLAYKGLLRKVIGGYWALTPRLGKMAQQGLIEAYNWPQGVISHLFRAIAGGKPGVITPIGLDTFIDPRHGGGKLNGQTHDDLIEVISLHGKEQLFYPSFPIHCAFLRGTIADEEGNVSMESEASFQDNLAQAQAVRNSGGIVIVQVLKVVPSGSLPAHDIRIPGILVDYLVVVEENDHWQTYGERFNSLFTGSGQVIKQNDEKPVCLNAKKIIARRAYLETLKYKNAVINLGIGTPEYISRVAIEEGKSNFTLTVESGAIGGYPAGSLSFGASINPRAILEQSAQFDFYDGGGIDIAFLGFGEVDRNGNVNVNKLGKKINGIGGFINISQSSQHLIFCGTFTANGLEIICNNGELKIAREGAIRKFVDKVRQINFNARCRYVQKKHVTYITERAVFELIEGKITLTEIAPGIDLEKD
ncbi:MAG: acyl CoA:acetate/3-ketoacid CoA transferase, partial [Gammaproteobacteria bacterium]